MKPVLYPKTETTYVDFGFGEISDALSVEVTRERNGDYSLYMKYPHDGIFADKLQKEMQLKADAGPRTKWQTFDVVRINKKSTDYIEVYAKHISFRLSGAVLKNAVTLTDVDARTALAQWKNNLVSDTVFDIDSDITTMGSVAWAIDKVTNAREALGGVSGSILDVYGGEYEFDNQLVKLHKQMGRKAPIVLEYGRNIQEIEVDDDDSETYNSILPFAKITQQEDEKSIEVLTTLPEIYIDGPFIGDYQRRIIKQVDFSTKFDSEKNKPTVEKLRSLAMSYVKSNEVGKPKTTIDVKYVDLASTLDYADMQVMEEVELCDILPLYYPKFGITSANEKVVKTVYDVYNDEYISLTLGTIGQTLRSQLSESTSGRIEALENKQKQFETELPTYLTNASGNRNWYDTPDDTQEHKIGDIWFEKNGQYERMYVWDGNQWILKIDTEDPDRIKRSIDQQFEDFNTSYDEAKALQDQQIADVLAKAGSAEDLAKEAKTDALSLTNQLSTARQILQDSIDQAKGDAFSEAGRLSGIVESNANARIDEMSDSIQLLAKKDDVDSLSGRVIAAESELKIQADAISQKVSHSELDPLNQQINQNQTSITQLSDRVTTEVSSLESKIPTEIGSVNLIDNTDYRKGITDWVEDGVSRILTNDYMKLQLLGTLNKRVYKYKDFNRPLNSGETITVSYTAYASRAGVGFSASTYDALPENQRVTLNQTPKRYIKTFNIVASLRLSLYVYGDVGDEVFIKDIKVERGAIATDWTPAPEDIDAELTSLKTTVTTTSDGVRQLTTKVTAAEGRVSSAETSINQLIGEISTKVAQRDYDNLLKHISSAETTIRTQAGQIEQRLTSTQVNQLIDTKGFATTSTVQNIVQNTADSFTQTISRVEGKIPTEIGGRNYILRDNIRKGYINNDGNLIINNTIFTTNQIDASKRKDWTVTTKSGWIRVNHYDVDGNFIKRDLYGPYTDKTSKPIRISAEVSMFDVSLDGTEYGEPYKVEFGSIATDWTPAPEDLTTTVAFNEVKSTVDAHTRTIGDIEGNVSRVTQTAQGLVQEVSGANGLKTQVSTLAGSWAVKNLTSNGAVLNQINLLADGTNRIDGRLTHITGSTLIDNAVIKSAMIGNAQINTAHIGTIDAGQANIININASNITSGTITGINMRGGSLTSLNGAVNFDLQSGHLNFLTSEATMRRQLAGYPTQFIKFDTGSNNESVTVIGANRGGNENPNDGNFAGIRIWNGTTSGGFYDYIDVAGDVINFTHKAVDGGSNTRRGWEMKSYGIGSDVSLRPIGYFSNAHITATEYRILNKSTNSYKDLSQVLDIIFDNFRNISEKGGFNRSYYSNWR
ncbi:peptidase [Streptococcus agalactiae LMG 14747]|uniref:Peptidase n=1 Tax=Streptococcus agalactiae LMG 14747 TaxID=1154860 RepID=V6Z2L0_STRAG|nr:peptidase [Streptococcus agalactiae LMG 14747]